MKAGVAALVGVLFTLSNAAHAQVADAQGRSAKAVTTQAAGQQSALTRQSLDEWILLHYRGAQLLPDSGQRSADSATHAGPPRIEGQRVDTRRDTLVAVHFNAAIWRSTLPAGTNVRLADQTGVVSTIAGRITARRAFRAPRKPGAILGKPDEWRIGWAYLVAIPLRTVSAAPTGFTGWSMIEAPPGNH